jgi:hypothetical protein
LFAVVLGSISSANDKTEKKKNGYQASAKTIPNFKMNKALAATRKQKKNKQLRHIHKIIRVRRLRCVSPPVIYDVVASAARNRNSKTKLQPKNEKRIFKLINYTE